MLHVGVCCAIVSVPCSLVVTCWERADLLSIAFVVFITFRLCPGPNQNKGRGWRRETGLSPPVKYFTERSTAVLLLWIFYVFFCLVFVMHLCASVYLCLVVTCWEMADLTWLSFVVYNCEFVTFSLVSLVRCVTWLYRFLIFNPYLLLVRAFISVYMYERSLAD